MFQFAHRRGLLKVRDHIGIVENVSCGKTRTTDAESSSSAASHSGLSTPVKWPFGVARIGPRQRVQRRRNHQFQIALGQHLVGIFEVQHLALLGDAQLAVEGIHRLRKDGAMRGSAAASDGAAATVKKPQLHAALARHHVQIAMGAENLPGAGQHAAIFV